MNNFIVILPVLLFIALLFRSPAFRDDKTGDYYKREVSGKTEIKDARTGKIFIEDATRQESDGWERLT